MLNDKEILLNKKEELKSLLSLKKTIIDIFEELFTIKNIVLEIEYHDKNQQIQINYSLEKKIKTNNKFYIKLSSINDELSITSNILFQNNSVNITASNSISELFLFSGIINLFLEKVSPEKQKFIVDKVNQLNDLSLQAIRLKKDINKLEREISITTSKMSYPHISEVLPFIKSFSIDHYLCDYFNIKYLDNSKLTPFEKRELKEVLSTQNHYTYVTSTALELSFIILFINNDQISLEDIKLSVNKNGTLYLYFNDNSGNSYIHKTKKAINKILSQQVLYQQELILTHNSQDGKLKLLNDKGLSLKEFNEIFMQDAILNKVKDF